MESFPRENADIGPVSLQLELGERSCPPRYRPSANAGPDRPWANRGYAKQGVEANRSTSINPSLTAIIIAALRECTSIFLLMLWM